MLSWDDGRYENTAVTLLQAAEASVSALDLRGGERVLDLGSGTGNAALLAARKGASVVAVDPAPRLLEVARQRAAQEGLALDARVGDASAIPAADGAFDAVSSVFAVIFAPDPDRAADEMLRVVRPGGRIAITTWTPRGPIAEAGAVLRKAMATLSSSSSPPSSAPSQAKAPPWGEEASVSELFVSRGATVTVERRTLPFEAASPEAWFAEQEANHPVWRFVHRALSERPADWESIRQQSIEHLRAGNEAKDHLRVTSDYLLVLVDRAPSTSVG